MASKIAFHVSLKSFLALSTIERRGVTIEMVSEISSDGGVGSGGGGLLAFIRSMGDYFYFSGTTRAEHLVA